MITIHSKVGCPFCISAKKFLTDKKLKFKEILYDPKNSNYIIKTNALKNKTKHPTFPQIFIGTKFIGGYDSLLQYYTTKK